jgi:hypothetical protein
LSPAQIAEADQRNPFTEQPQASFLQR